MTLAFVGRGLASIGTGSPSEKITPQQYTASRVLAESGSIVTAENGDRLRSE